jgi:hypothetical protein
VDIPEERASSDFEPVPSPGPISDPLQLLQRKTASLLLVGGESFLMVRCREWLWRGGYHRVEVVPDLKAAEDLCRNLGIGKPRLVLADISLAQSEEQEPLAMVLAMEKQLAPCQSAPMAILCEDLDPMFLFHQSEGTRILPCGVSEDRWLAALDDLLGIGSPMA